ncbi:helix-turn-helix domain-containing protein [Micromonospora sp. NBC_01813]|uniref:helix-turn-helix domain-containing protein n=1 Tax=Micromonospora sp. NBC_01813 TaxID=2975988 RepID=UPI002DD89940|nr:helix-turn-helix transcriptional regulator [Micromonospora sp. NBC_01813]WSA09068.1 helix-turn-helix transcriptional regulator [Micromonospora sp. NBC_01813]
MKKPTARPASAANTTPTKVNICRSSIRIENPIPPWTGRLNQRKMSGGHSPTNNSGSVKLPDTNEFRHALRRERMAQGMSQDALGAKIPISGSQIGNYESGKSIPPLDIADGLDKVLGTGTEMRELAEEARGEAVAPGLRPWTENEERATLLRMHQPLVIPGLLQTEEYARAIITAGVHTELQVEEMTRERMERKAATLDRADPVTLTAIVGEPALRYGDPSIMKDQLAHLVDIGHRPNVLVRVIPFSVGLHAGQAGAFIVATLVNDDRVGYLDDQLAGRIISTAREVGRLERLWENVSDVALSGRQSRDLIQRMIDEHS